MTDNTKRKLTAAAFGVGSYFILWPIPLCILSICFLMLVLLEN